MIASSNQTYNSNNNNANAGLQGGMSLEGLDHLVCKNENEIKKINQIVAEATNVLKELATTEDGYTLYNSKGRDFSLYFKKFVDYDVGKVRFQIKNSSKMNELINKIWDVNGSRIIDSNFIEGKIVRIYDNNTVLIHQCYKGSFGVDGRYFYIVANKKQIDEDTHIITCISINVDDSSSLSETSDKKSSESTSSTDCDIECVKQNNFFKNPLVKSADTFFITVDPVAYNVNTSLKKMFINISGYVVSKKGSNIDVVYVSSIQLGLSSIIPNFILKKIKASKMMLLQALQNCL